MQNRESAIGDRIQTTISISPTINIMVLGLRHLVWFMLTQFFQGGFRTRNLVISFLTFCCKKKKNNQSSLSSLHSIRNPTFSDFFKSKMEINKNSLTTIKQNLTRSVDPTSESNINETVTVLSSHTQTFIIKI